MNLSEAFEAGLAEVAVDGRHGIYAPQVFVERFGHRIPDQAENLSIVLRGPDDELYWEAWVELIDNGVLIDDEKHAWFIDTIDGDVWLIRDMCQIEECDWS